MNCLSWWLPLFVLPLPVCPPELFALFVVTYMLRTRPCAYCCLVLLGLFISTSYWSNSTPWRPTVPVVGDSASGFTDAISGASQDRLLRLSLPMSLPWQASPASDAQQPPPEIILDPGFDWRRWISTVRSRK